MSALPADATPLSVRPTDGLKALVTVGAFGMNDCFAPPIWSFAGLKPDLQSCRLLHDLQSQKRAGSSLSLRHERMVRLGLDADLLF